MTGEPQRIKIVVAGDSGVGKTALVHLLCRQEALVNPAWTVGCIIDVKMHDYRAGTPMETPFFVEFWDVSGSHCHPKTRSLFYSNADGIILVHDLSNRKSEQNLQRWLSEIMDKFPEFGLEQVCSGSSDSSHSYGSTTSRTLPVLVVATKVDLVGAEDLQRRSTLAAKFDYPELQLDCSSLRCLAPGSSHAVTLDRFLDRVVDARCPVAPPPSNIASGHFSAGSTGRRNVKPTSVKMGSGSWKND